MISGSMGMTTGLIKDSGLNIQTGSEKTERAANAPSVDSSSSNFEATLKSKVKKPSVDKKTEPKKVQPKEGQANSAEASKTTPVSIQKSEVSQKLENPDTDSVETKTISERNSGKIPTASAQPVDTKQMPSAEPKVASEPSVKDADGSRPAAPVQPEAVNATLAALLQNLKAAGQALEGVDKTGSQQDIEQGPVKEFAEKLFKELGIPVEKTIKALSETNAVQPQASIQKILIQKLGVKNDQVASFENLLKGELKTQGDSALEQVLVQSAANLTATGKEVDPKKEISTGLQAIDLLNGVDLKPADIMTAPQVRVQVKSETDLAYEKLQTSIDQITSKFMMTPSQKFGELKNVVVGEIDADSQDEAFDLGEDFEAIAKPNMEKSASLKETLESLVSARYFGQSNDTTAKASDGSSKKTANSKSESVVVNKEASGAKVVDKLDVMPQANSATPAPVSTTPHSEFKSVLGQQNPEGLKIENPAEVIRSAQLLVKEGGGEMKMQLKPEGLGEIHLKVASKDGQLDIQMITQTDSAKRALEKGLEELKTTLASHKLHVDALKIDVNSDLAKQRFEQSNQENAREQARQFAADFLGQMRQDREGFNQNLFNGFGGGSTRNYQQERRTAEMQPEPVVQSRSKASANSSRRLDLVA